MGVFRLKCLRYFVIDFFDFWPLKSEFSEDFLKCPGPIGREKNFPKVSEKRYFGGGGGGAPDFLFTLFTMRKSKMGWG